MTDIWSSLLEWGPRMNSQKLSYRKPGLQYWTAGDLDSIEATMSGGGGGGGTVSLPSMAACLASHFNFGESTNGAAVILEAFWDRINEVYSSSSLKYRNWLFFRSLGDLVYGATTRGGASWNAFAGVFSGLDYFFYDSLEMTSGAVRVIENAVTGTIDEEHDIDFPHMCIVVATHLAVDLGMCSVAALSSIGLTTNQDIVNVAGWGGDASIASPSVSFPYSDSMADMDAVNLAGKLLSGYSAKGAIRSYYTSFSNAKRVSTFKSAVYSSRGSYIEDILLYQILFGTSPSNVANYDSLEGALYLELNFPDVYSNFLAKL